MPASSKLVIVESPTKARTIRKYLGDEFRVEASMGHVRDLPANADEIPKRIKEKKWARLGVNVEKDFAPVYVVPADKKKVVKELKQALKDADELYLATDEDREGESIGWHLLQVLKPTVPTKRMVFHEITPEAILAALESPREIDEALVEAQETRRVLDRLVGYTVSPLLWKKVRPKLSAGRVQSVAVRLLVMRERERLRFKSGSYWDLKAAMAHTDSAFDAQLHSLGGKRLATGKDFDENTGQLIEGRDVLLLGEGNAKALQERLTGSPFSVAEVDKRESVRKPYPPFTTSTLQQEANRKLGFAAKRTMQVAQKLYENGHITYMRTDSVHLSDQAITAARSLVGARYGDKYLSPKARSFTTKSKGAQEAHEAIRPAGTEMRPVQDLRLSGDEARLYELIWKRTVATQMANAKLEFTSVKLEAKDPETGEVAEFRASGKKVVFPGFFRAYVEGSDDPNVALEDQSNPLPEMKQGDGVPCSDIEAIGHETKPPARYTEATLVKALESEGIGRPSTYASIIDTIQRRGYVMNKGKQLIPTFTALAVTGLLEQTHRHVVDTEFTAELERKLDNIASGKSMKDYLSEFYDSELLEGVSQGEELDPRLVCSVTSDAFAPYVVRVGRYGPYVQVEAEKEDEKPMSVSLPEELAPADLTKEVIDELVNKAKIGLEPLGTDDLGNPVYVLTGRYGPYVQLGEAPQEKGDPKPKRVSLPKGLAVEDVTLDIALRLAELPRELGPHPETGDKIKAGIGRYGPYVMHVTKPKTIYASLKKTDNILDVTLERGIELLKEKAAGRKGSAQAALKELGEHPDGGEIRVLDGRYGPYIKYKRTNVSLPEGVTVEGLTLDKAVEMIAAKKAKGGKKRKKTTKKKK